MSKPVGLFKEESFGWIQALPTKDDHNLIPLYTHPHKQLSDERIAEIWKYAKQTALNTRGGIVELIFARALIKEITE